MKFVVDEMPFWESDCPFYNQSSGYCKLYPYAVDCDYMKNPAGERKPEDCEWLTTKELMENDSES